MTITKELIFVTLTVLSVNALEYIQQPGKYDILILLDISDNWSCDNLKLSALLAKDHALRSLKKYNKEVFGSQVVGAKVYGTCGSYNWRNSRMKQIPTEQFIGVIGPVGTSKTYESIVRYNIPDSLPRIPLKAKQTSLDILNPRNQFELENGKKNKIIRVEPDDFDQSQAIIEVLEEFDWTYVNVVVQEHGEPYESSEVFLKEASKRGICIYNKYTMRAWGDDSGLTRLIMNRSHRTIVNVIFALPDKLKSFLTIFERIASAEDINNFVWISTSVPKGLSSDSTLAERLISLQNPTIPDYEDESLKRMMKCRCSEGQNAQVWYNKYCKKNNGCKNLQKPGNTLPVEPAVIAMVKATKKSMEMEGCGTNCTSAQIRNKMLYSLKKVNFTFGGLHYQFDARSDTTLITRQNLVMQKDGNVEVVGTYELEKLQLKHSLTSKFGGFSSVCSLPCKEGEREVHRGPEKCCWLCIKED